MRKLLTAAVLALTLVGGASKSHAIYDGTPSTGSFAIVTNSALASASASGTITINDNTNLSGTSIYIGPFQFVAGRDYAVGANVNASATNLAAAINAFQPYGMAGGLWVSAVANSAVVTVTAQSPGSAYNAVALKTGNGTEISVSGANLSGGQDNAVVVVNGVPLVQGRDWFKMDVASNTANNLAGAINHNPATHAVVNAIWLGGSSAEVYIQSALANISYPLSSTAGSAITVVQMTGGAAGNLFGLPSSCPPMGVNALPSANVPAGCLFYLSSDATHVYLSTQAVTGAAAANASNSYIAK